MMLTTGFYSPEAVTGLADCTACECPHNGLRMLHDETTPDFVFLDINMPTMTGFECLARIRQDSRLDRVNVVMYSTSNVQEYVDLSHKLGVNYFFTKPTHTRT